MTSTQGYTVKYRSSRALDADHAAYLIHGGMVVPMANASAEPNQVIMIRLQSPLGEEFTFKANVDRVLPGRGFMVSFIKSYEAQADLDAMINRPEFRKAVDKEDASRSEPPEVSLFQPASAEPTNDIEEPKDATDEFSTGGLNVSANSAESPVPDDATDPMPKLHPDVIAMTEAPEPPRPARTRRRRASPTASPEADRTDDGPALHPDLEALSDLEVPAPPEPEPTTGASLVSPPSGNTELRQPGPGERYWVYVLKYSTVREFSERAKEFETANLIRIPDEEENGPQVNDIAQLRFTLPGHNVFTMWSVIERTSSTAVDARVDPNDESFRKAILHPTTIPARKRLNREAASDTPRTPVQVLRLTQEQPKEDIEKMPIRRRLARMGMDDKINLALSGNREERMALAMDSNKAIHHYLLKNAKITVDEVAFMARLPSMNPDVLDKIAENPGYTQNPGVTKALVYNPRTPVKTAMRLLDRLPRSELMNLSKRMSMNQRLVMAAKNKILKYRP